MNSRRSRIIVAAVIFAAVLGFVFTITRGDRSRDLVLSIQPADPSNEVTVYVGGAVEEPGLYSLARGSRVAELIDLAGLLESADTSGLELAAILEDEQSILVPEIAQQRSDDVSSAGEPGTQSGASVNVNQASLNELELLPGIGPALAQRIIERRESVGPFGSLDELTEIAGISDRMVDDLRDLATVES